MENSYFMGRDGFMWFIGVVEDRNDPERLGRVRVRALGYHTEDKTKIPTDYEIVRMTHEELDNVIILDTSFLSKFNDATLPTKTILVLSTYSPFC